MANNSKRIVDNTKIQTQISDENVIHHIKHYAQVAILLNESTYGSKPINEQEFTHVFAEAYNDAFSKIDDVDQVQNAYYYALGSVEAHKYGIEDQKEVVAFAEYYSESREALEIGVHGNKYSDEITQHEFAKTYAHYRIESEDTFALAIRQAYSAADDMIKQQLTKHQSVTALGQVNWGNITEATDSATLVNVHHEQQDNNIGFCQ